MSTRGAMTAALEEARRLLEAFTSHSEGVEFLESFGATLADVLVSGGKILIAGNGGSHCDALHFAEEFTGRYRKERRPLPVMALGEASHVTCTGNDYGFEEIFARQVEAFCLESDVLVVLSTSGNSQNLVRAVEEAKAKNAFTVGLLGKGGGVLADLVDLKIVVPGETADRIQELHMMLLHMVIESVERRLFPENYENPR